MMLADTLEQSLFRSVESALAFAFSERYVYLPQSPASRMASTPSRSGNGLGGIDGYAQAGMILANVSALGELQAAILTARFSPPLGECHCGAPCCKGFRHNLRWLAAVATVSEFVGLEVPAILPYKRLREGIIRKHFGDKVRLGEVADNCGVHRNTASNHASRVLAALKEEEKRARFEIRAVLEGSGVVGT
jgi:hypothetical protein